MSWGCDNYNEIKTPLLCLVKVVAVTIIVAVLALMAVNIWFVVIGFDIFGPDLQPLSENSD